MRCPRRRDPGSAAMERWPPRRGRRPGVPSFPCRSRCPWASPGYADAHPIPGGRRVLHAQTVPADRARRDERGPPQAVPPSDLISMSMGLPRICRCPPDPGWAPSPTCANGTSRSGPTRRARAASSRPAFRPMSVRVIELANRGPDNRRAAPRSVRGILPMQELPLKRGLFGYTPESVRLLLADRDKMFIRAAERAREAEALVLELRSEMEALKAQIEERQEALRPAEAEAANLR